MHGTELVSPWVARWSHLVRAQGSVLDVACGAGRHTFHFLEQKCHLAPVDIDSVAIEYIANRLTQEQRSRTELLCADLENAPWPLPGRSFDAVVVTHYLWRPLMPVLMASVAQGGVLIYETFCAGNETVGKPSRPDFLLRPGELLQVCSEAGLRVIAYEDGFLSAPDRFMQRIAAVREESSLIPPPRHALRP